MRAGALLLLFLVPGSALGAGVVTIEAIEGAGLVQIERGSARLVAQEGDELAELDRITTAEKVATRLLYPDGSHLLISESSELVLLRPEAGARAAELKKGAVQAQIQKGQKGPGPAAPHKFFLRTGTAVMGVRGTEFVVDHDPATGATELHTLEGLVDAAGTQADLVAGRGAGVGAEQRVRVGRQGVGLIERFLRATFLRERQRREPLARRLGERVLRAVGELRLLRERRLGLGQRRGPDGIDRATLREDRKLIREQRQKLREDRRELLAPRERDGDGSGKDRDGDGRGSGRAR